MPAGTVNPWNDPHVIRRVIEMPLNRPDIFVRTTLQRHAEGYVPGEELWQAYRLWTHREPLSESSFLAALEKAGHTVVYDDDHVWYIDGWQWPGTAPVKADAKPIDSIREKPAERDYTFTEEVLPLGQIREIALLCTTFNGIAESIGWPARKFALYRARFPRVEKAIEQVWRDNPDRFKPEADTDTSGKTQVEKTTMIACARRALAGARARGNEKQIASAQARLRKLTGKG